MSENEIKPVAWTSECQLSAVRIQGDGIMMAKGRGWGIGLYDQSAIDALTKQIGELKTMLSIAEFQRKEMQAERDEAFAAADSKAGWEWKKRAEKSEAERDAAVAALARVKASVGAIYYGVRAGFSDETILEECVEAAPELAAIDAARAEGGV